MITTINKELCICIPHPEPLIHKEEIVKAIAAAIRWRASYKQEYDQDDFNLMILAQLLEELCMAE